MAKIICLTDAQDKPVYFDEGDLMQQVFAAGLIEMQGASKAAAMNLAKKVREMRDWQRRYFNAPQGSSEKAMALAKSKQFEKEVDSLLSKYIQTVPSLT